MDLGIVLWKDRDSTRSKVRKIYAHLVSMACDADRASLMQRFTSKEGSVRFTTAYNSLRY
jgi:hypothetical protein